MMSRLSIRTQVVFSATLAFALAASASADPQGRSPGARPGVPAARPMAPTVRPVVPAPAARPAPVRAPARPDFRPSRPGHAPGPVVVTPPRVRPPVVVNPSFRPAPVVVRPAPVIVRPGVVVVRPEFGNRGFYRPAPDWRIRPYSRRVIYTPGFNFNFWISSQYGYGSYNNFNQPYIEELGSTSLEMRTDFDLIPVRECGLNRIALNVLYNDVNLDHVVIHFANGEQSTIDLNSWYQEGGSSGWIDLAGYDRCVNAISVVGNTVYDRSHVEGVVQVWGRR